ncbi:hypothetical protein F753_08990 [Stutzerimonas chloritidismutans AW-1]|uniref:PglD N-terminal domain-containing protein n=1 Tax=Stutzerimonas chloritidismutans AW-1 TaxID=1263865 RepID=V4QD67_STUCH|nr:hypothetical protein [Stutzerimonas chloritidismutans]ESQ99727.1 hypothetical protein F753_08990 [Stutzerimonas chloritidismutans AW-1]
MNKSIYAVFGASGFGREVMPLVRASVGDHRLVFVDDNASVSTLNGHQVMSYGEFLELDAERKFVTIAIADAQVREKLTHRCLGDGIEVFDVAAANVVVMNDVAVGQGMILCPFTTITSNVNIGISFHANIYSYVAHDCVIGNYVTFAPGVKCNGNVLIGGGCRS